MIPRHFAKNRKVRVGFIFVFFLVVIYLATFLDGAYEQYGRKGKNELTLLSSFKLPIKELSGLFYNHKTQKLYGIGDADATVSVSDVMQGQVKNTESFDISQTLKNRFVICDSDLIPECHKMAKKITGQWEAISCVQGHQFFLLNEQLSTIFVYDTKINDLYATMTLEGYELKAKQRLKITIDERNAMGEGFVLLNNGHLLVTKERFDPSVVEFAPVQRDTAYGYKPGMQLDYDEPFLKQQGRSNYYPVKVWNIPRSHASCDLSELNYDDKGQLYLLSQECKLVMQLADLKPEDTHFVIKEEWTLPSGFAKAEAFAAISEGLFLIGEDHPSIERPNLFLFSKSDLAVQLAEADPSKDE